MRKIKYEKEIDQLLTELLREDWMNDEDYEEALGLTLEAIGSSKENLSEQLQVGVGHGHSIETQFELVKTIINKWVVKNIKKV